MSAKDVNSTCAIIVNGVTLKQDFFDLYFGLYYQIYHPLTIFSCVTGLITNLLNAVILTRPAMKSPLNFLLTILAISEIVFSLARVSWSVAYYIFPTRTEYATAYSAMFVNGLYTIESSSIFASEWLNITIGVWRLVAIKWPLRAKLFCNMRRAKIAVTAITVSSVLITLPCQLMLEICTYDFNGTSVPLFAWGHVKNIQVDFYLGLYAIVTDLLPILAAIGITICLIRNMHVAFRKHGHFISVIRLSSEENINGESRTTLMLTIMLVVFIFSYTPSFILFVSYYYSVEELTRFRCIFLLLQTMDNFTTFIIYFFISTKFRKTCRHLFLGKS